MIYEIVKVDDENTDNVSCPLSCVTCKNKKFEGYDQCELCIKIYTNICTCNKLFITGEPSKYIHKHIGNELHDLPTTIPDVFFTKLTEEYYHILGCRGCQHKEISVKDNIMGALQASIVSCVYTKTNIGYVYVSDSLDEEFEKYAKQHGLKIGNCEDINIVE